MTQVPLINEVWIFLASLIGALPAAWLTVRHARPEYPAWPLRVYLYFFRHSGWAWFQRYPDTRQTFSRREQFLTSLFIWFFIFFVVAIIALGCNRRGACW
jgi:hypothetical protein